MNKWTVLSNGDGKSIRKAKQTVMENYLCEAGASEADASEADASEADASEADADDCNDELESEEKKHLPNSAAIENKLKGKCFIKI